MMRFLWIHRNKNPFKKSFTRCKSDMMELPDSLVLLMIFYYIHLAVSTVAPPGSLYERFSIGAHQNFDLMRSITLAIIFAAGVALHPANGQESLKAEADALYLSVSNLDVGKMDSLKILSKRIWEISAEARYDLGIIRSKLVGASYGINTFKLDSALTLLAESGKLIKSNSDFQNSMEEGMMNFYVGQVKFRKMKLDEAEGSANRALALFEVHHNLLMMGATYAMLGTIEKLRDNEFKALSSFLKAYKLKIESGAPPTNLRTELQEIGHSYVQMGQSEKALEYFRRGQRIFAAIAADHLVLGNIYNAMGNAKSELSENDSALYYFLLSKEIAETHKNTALTAMVNSRIANLFTSVNRYKESNALVIPMIKMAGHSRFSPMAGSIRITAATNYFHLKKYDSAMLFAKQAFRMATSDQLKQALCSKIISDIFKARGNNDSALHYLGIHSQANTTFSNLDNQRKLSTLYAEIETLSKQNEIELLEKQKALDNAEKKFVIWGSGFGAVSFILVIITLRLQYHNKKKAHAVEKLHLQQELHLKEKDLHTQALKMIYLNNGITEIEANLKKLQAGTEGSQVQQLLSTIHINKSLEKEWDNFNKYFSSVHSDFHEKINARYLNLSISDTRLAGLIRMNMTNSEIASILNIESNSVKMAKYRLKKKVGLTDDDDIHTFLQKL
jgi:tetratricopeptide (TPR) repeat protein/DNA-binding CsgD family transcriptional regulator